MSLSSGNYSYSVCRVKNHPKLQADEVFSPVSSFWALLVFQGCLATLTPCSGQGWSAFGLRAWMWGGGGFWLNNLVGNMSPTTSAFKCHTPNPNCHDWHRPPLFSFYLFPDESTVIHYKNIDVSSSHQPKLLCSSQTLNLPGRGTHKSELFSTSMHHLLVVQTHPTVPLSPPAPLL